MWLYLRRSFFETKQILNYFYSQKNKLGRHFFSHKTVLGCIPLQFFVYLENKHEIKSYDVVIQVLLT